MRDVITGEAVVVDLPLAQLATRMLAFALDVALMAILLTLLLLGEAAAGLSRTDAAISAAVGIGTILLVFVALPVAVETLTRGRSVGKLAVGLRVVRDDGGPIRFRHALARGLAGLFVDFGVLSSFTGVVAVIASLVSRRGKRVGDMLAGTVVVRDRMPAQVSHGIPMPPPLAAWARSLALSQLPDDLALQARQFLLRTPSLAPHVRASLGSSFAAEIAAVVSPAPPPGTPPEAFVAAVLAERSRREAERLASRHAPHPVESPPQSFGGPVPPPPAGPAVPPPPAAEPPADGFALPR